MSNEIEVYGGGGELAPYSPSQPLAPAPDWSTTELSNREIDEYTRYGSGQVQLFGAAMPAGTTPQRLQQVLGEIAGVFLSDMSRLNHPQNVISAAINWFQNSATQPVRREQKNHHYNLHDQAHDPVAINFGNAMAKVGASQEFISNSLWWLGEVNKRLGASQDKPAQGSAPISNDPTDNLTDQQYSTLVKHNENVKAQTMDRLSALWGRYTFKQNIDIAQKHLESLPAVERKHFDCFTGNFPWTHMLNTVECLTALYDMAIGANSIPRDGAGIAREIASFEAMLKIPSERAKYMRDPQLQARLRELIRIRDGG